jgi:hypothetical protein
MSFCVPDIPHLSKFCLIASSVSYPASVAEASVAERQPGYAETHTAAKHFDLPAGNGLSLEGRHHVVVNRHGGIEPAEPRQPHEITVAGIFQHRPGNAQRQFGIRGLAPWALIASLLWKSPGEASLGIWAPNHRACTLPFSTLTFFRNGRSPQSLPPKLIERNSEAGSCGLVSEAGHTPLPGTPAAVRHSVTPDRHRKPSPTSPNKAAREASSVRNK